jgi:hypothetical protein
VAVALELILAPLFCRLFYLNDDVRNCGPVGIKDNNVRSFGRIPTKGDWIFNSEARTRVLEFILQALKPELANDFLRLGQDLLSSGAAFQVISAVPFNERGFDGGNILQAEDIKGELIL